MPLTPPLTHTATRGNPPSHTHTVTHAMHMNVIRLAAESRQTIRLYGQYAQQARCTLRSLRGRSPRTQLDPEPPRAAVCARLRERTEGTLRTEAPATRPSPASGACRGPAHAAPKSPRCVCGLLPAAWGRLQAVPAPGRAGRSGPWHAPCRAAAPHLGLRLHGAMQVGSLQLPRLRWLLQRPLRHSPWWQGRGAQGIPSCGWRAWWEGVARRLHLARQPPLHPPPLARASHRPSLQQLHPRQQYLLLLHQLGRLGVQRGWHRGLLVQPLYPPPHSFLHWHQV